MKVNYKGLEIQFEDFRELKKFLKSYSEKNDNDSEVKKSYVHWTPELLEKLWQLIQKKGQGKMPSIQDRKEFVEQEQLENCTATGNLYVILRQLTGAIPPMSDNIRQFIDSKKSDAIPF
jgi:hypothetical protein